MFAHRGALRGIGGGLLAGLLFAGLAASSSGQPAASDRAARLAEHGQVQLRSSHALS